MKEYKYKHLIFCGGGIKLYTFIGAIKVLEEKKILNNIAFDKKITPCIHI